MAEALTQDYVARFLIANSATGMRIPRVYVAFSRDNSDCVIGYIFMQYIDTPDFGEGDDKLVARAVQTVTLITSKVQAPLLDPSAEVALYTAFSSTGHQRNVQDGVRAPAAY